MRGQRASTHTAPGMELAEEEEAGAMGQTDDLGDQDDIRPDWSRHTTSHGESSFASARDEARYTPSDRCIPHARVPAKSVLQLGRSQLTGRPILLSETEQEHGVFMAAPPGAGKTMGIIYQGILREEGHRSVFVIDPKQEIERDTAGWLSAHHRVQAFAPLEPARSAHYNPLAHIQTYLEAKAFASSWITNTSAPDDRHSSFWTNAESLILAATVVHLIQTSDGTPPPFVALAELLRLPFSRLADLLRTSESVQARECVAQFLEYMRMAGETAAGVMMGLTPRFDLLTAPEIANVTCTDQLDFAAMGNGTQPPVALYLSIPDYAARLLQPLSAQFMTQMFTAWVRVANTTGGQLLRPIVAYLDEFTNAGHIPDFPRYVSMARSRRIALIISVQGFAQLRSAYGPEHTRTILTSAAHHIIFPRAGQDEAEFYSRRIGQTTVQATSQSRQQRTNPLPLDDFGGDESEATHVAGVPLLRPEELVRLPERELIVLTKDTRPLRLARVCWFEDRPEIRARRARPYALPPRKPDADAPTAVSPSARADGATSNARSARAWPNPLTTSRPARPWDELPRPNRPRSHRPPST